MNRSSFRAQDSQKAISILAATLLLAGCATRTYAPKTVSSVDMMNRVQSQESAKLRVRAAVPGASESEEIFGIPVYERGIQPIWIEVTNETDQRVRFAPVGVDREYFSPYEVAYIHKGQYKKKAHAEMEHHLYDLAMNRWIWPGETRSGFVFTHFEPGTKAFNIDLFGSEAGSASFNFFINVPGFEPDHAEVDFETLYGPEERVDLDDTGLRERLAEYGCCTTNRAGSEHGLPLNVVIVGDGLEVLKALLRAGWLERQRAAKASDAKFEQYWAGRPPDAIFAMHRGRRGESNNLRLWLAPMTLDDKQVWMGQVAHYVGQTTELGRALFDPRLDPDMDDAGLFFLQSMWYAQGLSAFAWQDTGESVPLVEPRMDFRNIAYFTSGVRLVVWLSGSPVSQMDARNVLWDKAPTGDDS